VLARTSPSELKATDGLRILAPVGYPWLFNSPRHSRHDIARRVFVPMNYVSKRLEGVTAFSPWPPRNFDLVHGFNRIPFGRAPFIIGFEDYLPRAFGLENSAYYRSLTAMLASPRCRQIVAISEHARTVFLSRHEGGRQADAILKKLTRRYPNIEIPDVEDALAGDDFSKLRLVFVGNDFARKGGCVAVKIAEKALTRGMPLHVDIVSSLNMGGGVWTDPVSPAFFDRYRALLELSNVTLHGKLGNAEVKALMARSHFSVLTTLGDTFGYSAIESMAHWTPVIATRQGALGEFVRHLDNGLLIDLETSSIGQWVHQSSPIRATAQFEKIFEDEIERMASETFDLLAELMSQPDKMRAMRRRARETAIEMFDSRKASLEWDADYARVVKA
jgi:glycosyltransferase involved in cell wall biosynthesis